MTPELRRVQISDVISRNHISTQEQMLALLAAEGTQTTQATLSRDLRNIGARKRAGIYRLPIDDGGRPVKRRRLVASLGELIIDAQATGPILVVTTRQGMAQAMALELSAADLPEVLGDIAGVDTVFVATVSAGRARALGRSLNGRGQREELRISP